MNSTMPSYALVYVLYLVLERLPVREVRAIIACVMEVGDRRAGDLMPTVHNDATLLAIAVDEVERLQKAWPKEAE